MAAKHKNKLKYLIILTNIDSQALKLSLIYMSWPLCKIHASKYRIMLPTMIYFLNWQFTYATVSFFAFFKQFILKKKPFLMIIRCYVKILQLMQQFIFVYLTYISLFNLSAFPFKHTFYHFLSTASHIIIFFLTQNHILLQTLHFVKWG